jgi:hypothetical protein
LNERDNRGKADVDRVNEKTCNVSALGFSHVSNNPQRQLEIFEALSLQDLNKIITNFKDDNECKSQQN